MKNIELLPLTDVQLSRVKKFAEMHRRYGGIVLEVIATNKDKTEALVRITDKRASASAEELVSKAFVLFDGEVPENLRIYFTLMPEEESKYYLTWDRKFLVRVHKYFFVWEVEEKENRLTVKEQPTIYLDPVVDSGNTETEKARKWLKNYAIEHKLWAL